MFVSDRSNGHGVGLRSPDLARKDAFLEFAVVFLVNLHKHVFNFFLAVYGSDRFLCVCPL